MALNLVSKNNMGVVTTLILVILLSQSRFFDFLTETAFGRMILLAFVIMISFTNKYFGLLSVLIIIIAFNQNNSNTVYAYNFYEGFDGSGNSVNGSGNSVDSSGNSVNKIDANKQSVADMVQQTTTMNNLPTDSSIPKESFKGREGFCMSDRELNILRGKQSNTVPVFNQSREQMDQVEPSDKSLFSSDYALFN